MSCQVVLQGFNPFDGVRETLEQQIDKLLDGAPSDANAYGSFLANRNGVSGDLNICSSQGKFSARGWARDMTQLEKKLVEEISGQISSWRDCRFDHESPNENFDGEMGWLGSLMH